MNRLKGVSTVIGGFLIHLTLGTFYTFGNMNTYMTSYLQQRVDSEVTYSKSIWVNALAMLGQGSLMMLGGMMERKIGAAWTSFVGCLIFSGSVALTSWGINVGFIAVVLLYGLVSSFGVGIAYIAPIAAGMKWFPSQKGLVTGVVVAGYGFGALVFNQVQTAYLNPMNIPPDEHGIFMEESILDAVPSIFLVLGAVYGGIQLFGCLLLFRPPEQLSEDHLRLLSDDTATEQYSCESGDEAGPSSINDGNSPNGNLATVNTGDEGMTPSQMVHTVEFYMLYATFALNAQSVQFINTLYKAFGQGFIKDDHFLSTVGSIASIFNAGGRILWGYLHDRSSYKSCMLVLSAFQTILMLTFVTTEYGGKLMFTLWVLAIFFSFAGLFVLMPSATACVFGKTHAGTNYGILFTSPAISSLAGAFLIQVIQTYFSWFGSFCLIASFCLLGFVITLCFPKNAEKRH